MHYKIVAPSVIIHSIPALVDQNFSDFTQLPYLPNPYFQYGNINMPSMPRSTPLVNNSFAYQYPDEYSQSYSQYINSVKPKGKKPTPKVKVDLSSSKPKVEKLVTKPKASTNKPGPKATWVPKSKWIGHWMYAGKKENFVVLGQWMLKAHDWRF